MSIKQSFKGHAKSRTSWVGLSIVLLSFVQANFDLVARHLGEAQGAVLFTVGLTIIALRHVTTTAVADK